MAPSSLRPFVVTVSAVGLAIIAAFAVAGGAEVIDGADGLLVQEGGDPAAIVEREGLGAMEDDGELAGIVAQVLADNPDVVERVKDGNEKAIGALVGPIMKATRGRADGGEVNRQIRQQLGI